MNHTFVDYMNILLDKHIISGRLQVLNLLRNALRRGVTPAPYVHIRMRQRVFSWTLDEVACGLPQQLPRVWIFDMIFTVLVARGRLGR